MGKNKVCGVKMESACHHINCDVFRPLKELTLSASCHSSKSSIRVSFARHLTQVGLSNWRSVAHVGSIGILNVHLLS